MAETTKATFYYPPLGFYYSVQFGIAEKVTDDARFQSVSGLSVEMEFETYREGGVNDFEHKLPGRTKYAELVLKRGMFLDSKVTEWCLNAFQNREFISSEVTITLMNEKGEGLRAWCVKNAIPKKWVVSDFNSGESAVVIETLELVYSSFSVKKPESNNEDYKR